MSVSYTTHRYHYNVANTRVEQHVEKGNDDGLYISSVACCQVGTNRGAGDRGPAGGRALWGGRGGAAAERQRSGSAAAAAKRSVKRGEGRAERSPGRGARVDVSTVSVARGGQPRADSCPHGC
jgi:hypothetical protein